MKEERSAFSAKRQLSKLIYLSIVKYVGYMLKINIKKLRDDTPVSPQVTVKACFKTTTGQGSTGSSGTTGTGSTGSTGSSGTTGTGSTGSSGTTGTGSTGSTGSSGTTGTGSTGSSGTTGTGSTGSTATTVTTPKVCVEEEGMDNPSVGYFMTMFEMFCA